MSVDERRPFSKSITLGKTRAYHNNNKNDVVQRVYQGLESVHRPVELNYLFIYFVHL